MHVILVGEDGERTRQVRDSLREGDRLEIIPGSDLLLASGELSESGRSLIASAARCDGVLFLWEFAAAPVLNTLTHAVRERLAGPSLALCAPGEAAEALAAGADAVLEPPWDSAMLEAKIFAHRRLLQVTASAVSRGVSAPWPAAPAETVRGLTVDPGSLRATHAGREVRLTPREAALLVYLVRRAGNVCSREELLDRVWGIRFDTGTNMVDVYVHFIRRRLESIGWPYRIATVRGAGYRFELPDERPDRTAIVDPSESAR